MAKRKDLTGEQFGKLYVVGLHESRNGRRYWLCKCDCGKEAIVSTAHLTTGNTISCGCAKKGVNTIDLTGQRFGRLTVINPTDIRKGNSVKWLCKCDCGKKCIVASIDLRNGSTRSCGCIASEVSSRTIKTAMKTRQSYMIEGTDVINIASKKLQINNTSGCRGVSYDKSVNLWKAIVIFKGVKYYLGAYRDKKDAIEARKAAEKEIHGPFLKWYAENYPENWEKLKKTTSQ